MLTYGDVHFEGERQWSFYNFEKANIVMLKQHFVDWEKEAKKLVQEKLALPAYDAVMKCSHLFNLLDARGAISTAERIDYILRVRTIAKIVAEEHLRFVESEK
jgi:glycyl-tRNA synthetase alpha chain